MIGLHKLRDEGEMFAAQWVSKRLVLSFYNVLAGAGCVWSPPLARVDRRNTALACWPWQLSRPATSKRA